MYYFTTVWRMLLPDDGAGGGSRPPSLLSDKPRLASLQHRSQKTEPAADGAEQKASASDSKTTNKQYEEVYL